MTEPTNADLPEPGIAEGEVDAARVGPPEPAALGLDLPDDPRAATDLLLTEVDVARNEANAYLADLKRVAADFENFRKRAMREQAAIVARAAERVIRELLPVLDSFDAALAIDPQTESEEKLLGGMRSTHTQLLDALAKEGLEVIPSWGEPFDPEVHEAVMSPSGGTGTLVVAQEMRRGYRLSGKVLRAALVALEYSEQAPS